MLITWLFMALLVASLFIFIHLYNALTAARNDAYEEWGNIDVQLKRRADLIPNLVETVKGYAAHEKTVLDQVTAARTQATQAVTTAQKGQAEGALSSALRNLFVVAENYPDLKASQNFQELQRALASTEEQIQQARRGYNAAVRNFNNKIFTFPSLLVANICHFNEMRYFEMDASADKNPPQVKI